MKLLLIKFAFLLILGNPESNNASATHSESSGDYNLETLKQIESLLKKKAGAELQKNSKNTFQLNGYEVYTGVTCNRFGPSVLEETFYEIENPDNICKIRLVKNDNGDTEFAVLIKTNEGLRNYHAVFDYEGNMLEEDPWGIEEGYTIKTFDLYREYQKLFAQKVDKVK